MEYILIFISAIFVNNIVLSQFLGICPFLGVSKKVDTSLGMSAAVAFVLTLATIVTWLVQHYVLDVFGLAYLQTIAFILVIAALVQMVEIILKKVSPALYQALGIFLPLITTNCAVLGVAILVIQKDFSLLQSVVYAFSTALGFGLALTVFAGMREQMELSSIPKGMRGMAIVMLSAGLLSLAIMASLELTAACDCCSVSTDLSDFHYTGRCVKVIVTPPFFRTFSFLHRWLFSFSVPMFLPFCPIVARLILGFNADSLVTY